MYPGECRLITCTGTEFISVVLTSFNKTYLATGQFVKPPGYVTFSGKLWSGGASGGRSGGAGMAQGGSGGGCFPFDFPASKLAASETITIGAGGVAETTAAPSGRDGGDSSFGTTPLITVMGGEGGTSTPSSGAVTRYDALTNAMVRLQNDVGGFSSASYSAVTGRADSAVWGGGGICTHIDGARGGGSTYGGGGGASVSNAGATFTGGPSVFGGAGGASGDTTNGTAGTVPGGGGGATRTGTASGAGAAGQCTIWGVL